MARLCAGLEVCCGLQKGLGTYMLQHHGVPVEPKNLTGDTFASQMLPQVSIVIKPLLRCKDSNTLPSLMGVSGI